MDEGGRERAASIQGARGGGEEASYRGGWGAVARDDALDEEEPGDCGRGLGSRSSLGVVAAFLALHDQSNAFNSEVTEGAEKNLGREFDDDPRGLCTSLLGFVLIDHFRRSHGFAFQRA